MRHLSTLELSAVAGGFAPPGGLPEPPPSSTPRGGGGAGGAAGVVAALLTVAWELYTNWDKVSADAKTFYNTLQSWLSGNDLNFDNCYYSSSGCGAADTLMQTYWDEISPDSPTRRNPWDLAI